MTKRSRGVLKTRWSAMVSSTTPRFGPRWPPVCESTLINSSRTSCASCGRLSSGNAFTSAGERIPWSKEVGSTSVSEEANIDIFWFSFGFRRGADSCRGGRLKFFHDRFAGAVAGDDLDSLFGGGEAFLADFDQLHSLLVANNQVFKRKIARFHLLHDLFEPFHGLLEVRFGRGLLPLVRQNGKGIN